KFLGHMKLGIHLRLEDRQRTELVEFGSVRLEVEATGNQRVETRVQRLARRGGQIRAAHGAEFRSNENGGALFGLALHEPALGGDPRSGPAGDISKGDAISLLCLLDTGGFQVV